MAGAGNSFEQFRKRLEALKSTQFQATLAQRCGAAAMKATADCFRKSQDPYGFAWARLRFRVGHPLRNTGLMQASISAQPAQGSFRLVCPAKQARLMNFGGTVVPVNAKALRFKGPGGKFIFAKKVTIPPRPFFPDARGIPPAMAEAFAEEFRELVREVVAG